MGHDRLPHHSAPSLNLRALGACLLAVAPLAPVAARAQTAHGPLKIEASTRLRAEAIAGQFRAVGPDHDMMVSARTVIAAQYDLGRIRIGGEIVDARGYGENRNSSARDLNAVEPVQAYLGLGLDGLAGKGSTGLIKAGRFSLDVGSSRLVGRPDFPNTVQSYAGAALDWRSAKGDRLVAFWTEPFVTRPLLAADILDNVAQLDRASGGMRFFGASATKAGLGAGVDGELYAYRLLERDTPGYATRDRRLTTIGGRLRRGPATGRLDFELEGAIQHGLARATASAADVRDLAVDAGFGHAEVGWTMKTAWTPRISADFDAVSGDGPDPGRYGRFDTLFGARRADFGPLSLYGAVSRANLISPGVRIEAKPSARLDLMAGVRGLWLANATDSFGASGVRDPSGGSGSYAGTQVEVRARRWLSPKRLRLEFGAALLAKGRFLTDAPNAPRTGDTRYVYTDLALTL